VFSPNEKKKSIEDSTTNNTQGVVSMVPGLRHAVTKKGQGVGGSHASFVLLDLLFSWTDFKCYNCKNSWIEGVTRVPKSWCRVKIPIDVTRIFLLQ
jgi:hypothetical protein